MSWKYKALTLKFQGYFIGCTVLKNLKIEPLDTIQSQEIPDGDHKINLKQFKST